MLSDLLGYRVRRKLGAGRTDDEGDLDGLPDCVVEVKAYNSVAAGITAALADLETERRNAGATFAAAFVKRPRTGYCVVMNPEHFATLYREATA